MAWLTARSRKTCVVPLVGQWISRSATRSAVASGERKGGPGRGRRSLRLHFKLVRVDTALRDLGGQGGVLIEAAGEVIHLDFRGPAGRGGRRLFRLVGS